MGEPINGEDLQLVGPGFGIRSSLEDETAFIRFATLLRVAPGAVVDLSGVLRVEDSVGFELNNSFGSLVRFGTTSNRA